MTMIERVSSFNNEYFNGLIVKYSGNGQAPESHGMHRAIMAYLRSNDENLSGLMVDDMPFIQDMDDFMGTIEAAGITEFLLCDTSTGLMGSLHYLMGHGWQIIGTREYAPNPYSKRQGLCMIKA